MGRYGFSNKAHIRQISHLHSSRHPLGMCTLLICAIQIMRPGGTRAICMICAQFLYLLRATLFNVLCRDVFTPTLSRGGVSGTCMVGIDSTALSRVPVNSLLRDSSKSTGLGPFPDFWKYSILSCNKKAANAGFSGRIYFINCKRRRIQDKRESKTHKRRTGRKAGFNAHYDNTNYSKRMYGAKLFSQDAAGKAN